MRSSVPFSDLIYNRTVHFSTCTLSPGCTSTEFLERTTNSTHRKHTKSSNTWILCFSIIARYLFDTEIFHIYDGNTYYLRGNWAMTISRLLTDFPMDGWRGIKLAGVEHSQQHREVAWWHTHLTCNYGDQGAPQLLPRIFKTRMTICFFTTFRATEVVPNLGNVNSSNHKTF